MYCCIWNRGPDDCKVVLWPSRPVSMTLLLGTVSSFSSETSIINGKSATLELNDVSRGNRTKFYLLDGLVQSRYLKFVQASVSVACHKKISCSCRPNKRSCNNGARHPPLDSWMPSSFFLHSQRKYVGKSHLFTETYDNFIAD